MPEVSTQDRRLQDIDMEPEPGGQLAAPGRADTGASHPSEPRPVAPRTTVVRELNDAPQPAGRTLSVERVIVRHSDECAELFAAMAAAQGEFGDVERTLEAEVASKRTGGKFSYGYETLGDVIRATRAPMAKNGLACMQFPFPGAQYLTLRTMVTHKSGQWIYNDMICLIDGLDPQAVASGTTYLKRIARKSIFGIGVDDEDDDGAAAMQGQGRQASAPQAGQRRSQQPPQQPKPDQPQPSAQPAPAQAAPDVQADRGKVGIIVKVEPHANGATVVTLDTGFRAGTHDAEIAKSLTTMQAIKNARVELVTHPSAKGANYLPVVDEVLIANGKQ